MGISTFKKSVWETALLTQWRGISVADIITTPPSKVEGTQAIFNNVSGGTVADYIPGTTSVSYAQANTASIELIFDKMKYFALSIDDVDATQAAGPVLSVLAQEKAYDLKEVVDTDLLTEIAKVPTTANLQLIGTSAAKKAIATPSQAYDYVVDLGTILSTKKAPLSNRFVVAKAEFVNLMAKDARFADNFNVLPNGVVQGATINGMTIIQCEEVPANTVLALHKSAFGYGSQINKVEALRLETSFSDAVRGLAVYGRVPLRTNGVAGLLYTIS